MCTGKKARKEGDQEADQEDQEGPQEKTVETKKDHEDKKDQAAAQVEPEPSSSLLTTRNGDHGLQIPS